MKFSQLTIDGLVLSPVTKQQNGSFVFRNGASVHSPRIVMGTRLPTAKEPTSRVEINFQTYSPQVCATTCSKTYPARSMFATKVVSSLEIDRTEREADLADYRKVINSAEFAAMVLDGDVIYT